MHPPFIWLEIHVCHRIRVRLHVVVDQEFEVVILDSLREIERRRFSGDVENHEHLLVVKCSR